MHYLDFSLTQPLVHLGKEFISFLGISHWLTMIKTGDYSSLRTLDGIVDACGPLIPMLLLVEMSRALMMNQFRLKDYSLAFWIYIFNRFLSGFISIAAVTFCIGLFQPFAILKTQFTWYWLIYGYIVWEFSHFIYHYLAHKVRLFWCLHSTHHAPQQMNLSVTFAHFFLEAPYANVIRTTICILGGLNVPMLFFIMFIDGTWGAFIHAGEGLLKEGRLGMLEHIILTPAHHRVHHAKNPLYIDTNFCNLLNIWDRVFGTLQPIKSDIAIEYGITRQSSPNNFIDSYFGELPLLWKDIKNAPGIKNKLLYLVMPPGWSHTGDHKTAGKAREEFLKGLKH